MPSTRVAVPEIKSWTPAIDARSVEDGSLFVLSGRNFLFDAKGPKSAFGSMLLDSDPIDTSVYPVESMNVGNRVIVATYDAIYERRSAVSIDYESDELTPSEDYFFKLADLVSLPTHEIGKYKWTSAYVGFGSFINHPGYGLFRLLGDSIEPHTAPGLEGPFLGITESAGRLIVQTNTLTQWSNADNASDFTPELGGAGFQVTKQRTPGAPLAVTSFQGGFIVWSTAGVLVAEFVGGNTVFRFDRVITEQFLLTPVGFESVASGDVLVVTQHGIFKSSATQGLQPFDEVFNEYMRTLMENEDDVSFRLKYIKEMDTLFVQMYNQTTLVNQTFVFSGPTSKWGIFSETHKGIIKFDRDAGKYGYVDSNGYIRQFTDQPFVEELGGALRGLDSFIELGYVQPANGAEQADVEFEMQEILIGARTTHTLAYTVDEEDWDGPDSFKSYNIGFYLYDQDWSQFGVDYYDIDYNDPAPDENWNNSTLPNVDWNNPVAGQRDFNWNDNIYLDIDWSATPEDGVNTDYIEDWGIVDESVDVEEDWDGEGHFFNVVTYGLTVKSNMDGFEEELTIEPALAVEKTTEDLWTLFSYGHRQRIVLTANQPWEKFHVTTMEISISYAGQIS